MAGQATFGRISEAEFASLLQALSSTSKGRAFLNDYRQRFQPEETLGLLESLRRIEETMIAVRDQLQPERIADELRHVAMSLDIALEGAGADPEGDDTERRFALAKRARNELQTLAANLAGGAPGPVVVRAGDDTEADGVTYRLRDPADDR